MHLLPITGDATVNKVQSISWDTAVHLKGTDRPRNVPETSRSETLAERVRRDSSAMNLLSREDLRKRGIRFSNPHMLRLEQQEKFPRRIYLSPARVAWIESEVLEYIARCVAARG
jgi:prophage regulatory protein